MRVDIYMMMNVNVNKKKMTIIGIELISSFFILTIFRMFIHEMGHVIVALMQGIKIHSIHVGFFSGIVFYEPRMYPIESLILLYLGGLLFGHVVFIPLFIMTRKKLKIFAVVFLVVLVAEAAYFLKWNAYSDISIILRMYPEGEWFFKSATVILNVFFWILLVAYFTSVVFRTGEKHVKPRLTPEMIAFYELHDKIMEQHDDYLQL